VDYATWAIVFLLLGLVLLVLEFFVPSGGTLAVMCALSFLAAIVAGFFAGPWTGALTLLTVCIVVPAACAAAVRWWPDTAIGKMILVERPRSSDEVLPETVAYRGLRDLVGRRGKSKGLMLPSGLVLIDGKSYDAVSEGMPIEPGEQIIVVHVSTQRLVVRPDHTIQAELAQAPPTGPVTAPATAQVTTPATTPVRNPNEPLVPDVPDPFAE
jgi:membrane-bound ClpP family serine protease